MVFQGLGAIEAEKRKRKEDEAKALREEERKKRDIETEQTQRRRTLDIDRRRLQSEGLLVPEEVKKEREAGEAFLEEKGFAEEKLPERVELDIEREGVEKLPVLGPQIAASSTVGEQTIIGKVSRAFLKKQLPEEKQPLLLTPETEREIALQAIQIEEVKRGTSSSEKFGALTESLILVPINKWIGGSYEAPAANVVTVTKSIKELRGTVLKDYEAVRANLVDPYVAYEAILTAEEDIYRLEQRIKNLSNESRELIADADALNLIEDKILRAKKVIYYAKQAAATQLRGEPTDAAVEAYLMTEIRALEDEES